MNSRKLLSKTFYYAGNALYLSGGALMMLGVWLSDKHADMEKTESK